MPPKKKEAGAGGDEEEPLEEDKELLEKELVIGYLKMKYQDQGERLEVENLRLSQELEHSKLNLKDINEFLTNELKARALSSAALEHRKKELEQELAEQKVQYEERISRLVSGHESYVEELLEKMADSDRQARQAQDFLSKREELVQEIQELKDTLKLAKKEYEERINEIERTHVQDRDKWKRTMHLRIQNTKQFMMKLTDNQLEMTTKRTIMENEQMSAEMAYQSRQTNKILTRNKTLETQKADLKRALALSRDTENELAKRNTVYQSTICQLLTKLKMRDELEEGDRKHASDLDIRMEELEEMAHLNKLSNDDKEAQLEQLREELIRRDLEVASMKASVDDSAQFLLRCMQDVKEKVVTILPRNEPGQDAEISVLPGKLEELTLEQRERALSYLLQKLHLVQGLGQDIIGIARPATSEDHIVLPQLAPKHKPVALEHASPASPWPELPSREPAAEAGQGQIIRVSASTQTAYPDMESADKLLGKVLSDVRPWGSKTAKHPLSVKPAYSAPEPERFAPGTRGSLASTPLSPKVLRGASHFRMPASPLPGPYRQIAA